MTAETRQQTFEFQTEAKQLLQLMIHSLYSNKEIFMRELVSNASDACDKLRFQALADDSLFEGDTELEIRISFDKDDKTITIVDNGIGMNRQDIIDNIGTIAKSGTREFIDSLTGDQKKDSQLIGQFGVGFYSGFIVAKEIEIKSRRAGEPADQGVHWRSNGEGSYTLEPLERTARGTEVILHLRDEEQDLLDYYRLRNIVKKYSDHINLPIRMPVQADADKEKDADKAESPEWETVNQASALWTRPKKEISDEEYNEFYKTVSLDFEEPLARIHNQVEGTNSYTTLFYIPKRAPFDLFDRDKRHGIKLYVKRVYIMDDAEHLMPNYLRFVRGVVDSDDLPLNVSREILQANPLIDRIRSASVKKILGLLESMAKNEKEKYAEFWKAFGKVLKEGPAEDFGNRERIARLLRFSSTHETSETPDVSLEDYVGRMKPGQKHIYYITADSFAAAKNSPHLEIFKKHGIEVLLMYDRIDEWMMQYLTEFDGRKLQSVAKGELDLGEITTGEDAAKETEKAQSEYKEMIEKMSKVLGERVKEVRISRRLTESPSCLIVGEGEMAINLQNLFKQAGHEVPGVKPVLEINPDHLLVKRLNSETDEQQFSDWTHILFDQALLSEGGQLEDPSGFVGRLNDMFTKFALR